MALMSAADATFVEVKTKEKAKTWIHLISRLMDVIKYVGRHSSNFNL